MRQPLVILGAGGHSKVVVDLVSALGVPIRAMFDDDVAKHGSRCAEILIVGGITMEAVASFLPAQGVVGIGSNRIRQQLVRRLAGMEFAAALVHPRAYCAPSVSLGQGSVVFAGAVIQPETIVGRHCIVNTAASIDHDCRLGDFVHVCPGVRLAGSVRLGDGVLLGTGAVVIPGVTIGDHAVVGAGTVVIHDIPAGATAVGNPARIIKTS